MKRYLATFLVILICFFNLSSCADTSTPFVTPEKETVRFSAYVGVWTDKKETSYYRFTPAGIWYLYNALGEVERKGEVELDGETMNLVAEDGQVNRLFLSGNGFRDEKENSFHRTDSPSSLVAAVEYEGFFHDWYEEYDLLGNVLTISEPDSWCLKDPEGEVLDQGSFYAYANESDRLYLYQEAEDVFFACLSLDQNTLIMERTREDRLMKTEFALAENSTERYFYFKDKGVFCDYDLDSGMRLLRNGGAAYNDAHDYKKMPVTCRIDTLSDALNEEGQRTVSLSVVYEFKRTDLPYLSGGVFYNSVRFSQYDYYTGEVFNLEDSMGNENLVSHWITSHDGVDYAISCEFSSEWIYSQSEDTLARFVGTYQLTMPPSYDGFVICLRPVFNSYSAQVSSSLSPAEGTLMIEDVGDDVEKSIFCRIPRFTQPWDLQCIS